MKIARQIVVFDAADLNAESAFWAELLGGTVDTEDDWHSVYVDGEPRIGVQLAPGHVPPDWPDGAAQQVHLDLFVDDVKVYAGGDDRSDLLAHVSDMLVDDVARIGS